MLKLTKLVALTAAFGGVSACDGAVSSCDNAVVDPATERYALTLFGVGDWGNSLDSGSCCSGLHSNYDLLAQKVVATLMNIQAKNHGVPDVLLAHGDNFYWTGLTSMKSRDSRFAATYENVYNGEYIKNVLTLATLGNHDMGGANYLCQSNDVQVPCKDTAAMLGGLKDKYELQANYTSRHNNRWRMNGRYFVQRIKDPATGISIDIFNVDTNDADVAGKVGVCCQCYGYSGTDNSGCNSVTRESKYCCGGDKNMYDSCIADFDSWGERSRAQLAKDAALSNATYKIVNSHFSPVQHFNQDGMEKWVNALRGSGVHVFMYGHTHGEKHDYFDSLRLHFVENGAGGGAKKEPASTIPAYAANSVKRVWAYSGDEYGFMSIKASKNYLKLEYHTADNDWVLTDNFATSKIGSVATKHCHYIPSDGSKGRAC